MNKDNWNNIFPDPPESFHNKVSDTLFSLPDKKEISEMNNRSIFRKIPIKRGVLIALVATVAVGTTVLAGGKIASIVGSSSTIPTYFSMPSAEKINKDFNFEPKLVEKFDTGYEFKSGHKVKNEFLDKNNNSLGKQNTLDIEYEKGDDNLSLGLAKGKLGEESDGKKLLENYKGIDLSYIAYSNKVVPADYKLTEQDEKDEASGKYVFSYGSDEVEVSESKHLSWMQDGISYMFTAIDSDVTSEQLVEMAHQMIDSIYK
ncbi:signal peptide protein [Clostridioides mangenotii]|uniref:hypothetical protein n=1 Tax=Metaclostridioides mangenotii TaxID=1540 RepID=UPI002149DC7E|nr:hypothetical protein [Clostridioides mangenotii]MCR1954300.1 signal peptide protein [Clostridioides mangenotii]